MSYRRPLHLLYDRRADVVESDVYVVPENRNLETVQNKNVGFQHAW